MFTPRHLVSSHDDDPRSWSPDPYWHLFLDMSDLADQLVMRIGDAEVRERLQRIIGAEGAWPER